MAKAKFHKSQRVYVKPVGTWAFVESVIPKWSRGVEEPIKIGYDVGMGREFAQEELLNEPQAGEISGIPSPDDKTDQENWHIVRGHNKWKDERECGHHPFPGTHPVIVTTEREWGGWRVPGAEYDRDPIRIERQAILMGKAPMLAALLVQFIENAESQPENMPDSTVQLVRLAKKVLASADI